MEPANGDGERLIVRRRALAAETVEFLRCLACRKVAVPPVSTCALGGHILCSLCRPKMERCPACQEGLNGTGTGPLHRLLAHISKTCPHGLCSADIPLGELEAHKVTCDYRPVRCEAVVCAGALIPFADYAAHVAQTHDVPLMDLTPDPCTVHLDLLEGPGDPWPRRRKEWLFSYNGVKFVLHAVVGGTMFHVWVSAILPEVEASKYRAKIGVKRTPGPNDEAGCCIEWTSVTHSIHVPYETVLALFDVVQFRPSIITQYVGARVITIDIRIFKG